MLPKNRIFLVLVCICFFGAPYKTYGQFAEIFSMLKDGSSMNEILKDIYNMSTALSDLKVIQTQQKNDIQNIYGHFQSLEKGEAFKNYIDENYFTYDTRKTVYDSEVGSRIVSKYTGVDLVSNVEKNVNNTSKSILDSITEVDIKTSAGMRNTNTPVQDVIASEMAEKKKPIIEDARNISKLSAEEKSNMALNQGQQNLAIQEEVKLQSRAQTDYLMDLQKMTKDNYDRNNAEEIKRQKAFYPDGKAPYQAKEIDFFNLKYLR